MINLFLKLKSFYVNVQSVESASFDEEFRTTGSVGFSVYWKYFVAGGGRAPFSFFMLNCIFCQFLFSGSDYWLSLWTDAEQHRADRLTNNLLNLTASDNVNQSTSSVVDSENFFKELDTNTGVTVFTILTAGVFSFALVRSIQFFVICMKSSINLHNSMFNSIIRVPLLFLDHNPVGIRIHFVVNIEATLYFLTFK